MSNTILTQLGGSRFITMTGARNFIGSDRVLAFAVVCPKNKANRVHITLTSDDLYTVVFGRIALSKYAVISEHEGIYADQLQALFTEQTGLATRL